MLGLAVSGPVCSSVRAGPTPGPWTPLFKGVDHAVGTNQPGVPGNFSLLQVVHCVRVNLTDPDVRFFSTPRASSYAVESRETLTQTVPHFLSQNHLQIACDANFYNANPGGSDPSSEGVSCDVFGLEISEGTLVSPQTSADAVGDPRSASLLFTTNNQPFFVFVNRPPGTNTTGIYNAITGYYPIVSNGVNIGAAASTSYPDSTIHQTQPRTAFGVSQDQRFLFLMTIDGRQSGYSDGALDAQTAYWMLQFGAWNAVNMDGGGSTALYMSDSAGRPVALNHSSYLAAYGHERYIGSHFGVYAKPLPGFINDVAALADDTAATITWTTTSPATTQVSFGLTTNLDQTSALLATPTTNHAALLTGLAPNTGYYFSVLSQMGTTQFASPSFYFVTSNYATTNAIFGLDHSWTYTTANLDGVNWQATNYDDSGWVGSGPGLLWVDTRGFANPNIPVPMNTEMPSDPGTAFPYPTYYFRTHFAFTNGLQGATLLVSDYIDDGAVFYLNGAEVYRLRMAPSPAPIYNATLAAGYACGGDATCPDDFAILGDAVTNLVVGDNVLAVEVHNYNAKSPDITFGASLASMESYSVSPMVSVVSSSGAAVLTWSRGGFTLQQADSPGGPWADTPGPVVSSPFIVPTSGTAQYFRLHR